MWVVTTTRLDGADVRMLGSLFGSRVPCPWDEGAAISRWLKTRWFAQGVVGKVRMGFDL